MGLFFCKKGKWGVFFVKVEHGGGCFCKESGPFLNAGRIMYSIKYFFILHFTYWGGCVHTQCTPLPTGRVRLVRCEQNNSVHQHFSHTTENKLNCDQLHFNVSQLN